MRPDWLPTGNVSFSTYFDVDQDTEAVLEHFHCRFVREHAVLPRWEDPLAQPWLEALRERLDASLPYLSLNNETARREFLIAPLLQELSYHLKVKIRVEFPLDVSELLRGSLDYLLQTEQNLLVIEAKKADMTRGFTQLAVELLALDQWTKSDAPVLYGAVTIGNVWQFGFLQREERCVTQDLNLWRVPADLPEVLAILSGILVSTPS